MMGVLLAALLYVEAEGFDDCGDWILDCASTSEMGSSYLMAHGYGVPVKDAEKRIIITEKGRYAVWARTRNWAAPWTDYAPGRFDVAIDGVALSSCGTQGADWHWQKAGVVALTAGEHKITLHDRTGFNGRCDAVVLTTDDVDEDALETVRRAHQATPIVEGGTYDFIVCGGGIAGMCAAQAAARATAKTLLLQDREVVGGCNSSEIRVGLGGDIHIGPNPNLGNVVEEIAPIVGGGTVDHPEDYEDVRKRNSCRAGLNARFLTLRMGQRVYGGETNGAGAITAVLARHVRTGVRTRYRSDLFCDATGDALLARLTGCATMYGRESRTQFGEISAPEKGDRQVMGHSMQWTTTKTTADASFPDIAKWALKIDEQSAVYSRVGGWAQEAGQYRDMAVESETIRDYGLLAIFSNWHYLKNVSPRRGEFARDRFTWISPIGGKREGYRVIGDYVLTQNDLEKPKSLPDPTAAVTWDIDQHFPDPHNAAAFKEPFLSCAYHRGFGNRPVPVPYRCLYARDCPNLFLAGRHISVSHVALAAVRVQRTLGMLGEAVGIAAALAWEHGCTPRDLYVTYLDELMGRIKAGVPKNPTYHAYPQGLHEKYHFWGHPQVNVYPETETNLFAGAKQSIGALGMIHRNEHPDFKTPPEKPTRRRLVLADESRAQLIVYDSCNARGRYAISAEKPMWDLKKVAPTRYRVVVRRGFMVIDIATRKVVETFRHPRLNELTAICDLPEGGFLACVSPGGYGLTNDIEIVRFDAARKLDRVWTLPGYFNSRAMMRKPNGELLVTYEHGFVRVRLGAGAHGEILQRFIQPAGRNLFEVVPDFAGTGYWAGTGYGAELVHFAADGTADKVWKAAQESGRRNVFYAQPQELANGHVYVCNWTGHGWNDSKRGWQVLEFDATGKVVWHLDDWEMFGSLSGIDVLEAP